MKFGLQIYICFVFTTGIYIFNNNKYSFPISLYISISLLPKIMVVPQVPFLFLRILPFIPLYSFHLSLYFPPSVPLSWQGWGKIRLGTTKHADLLLTQHKIVRYNVNISGGQKSFTTHSDWFIDRYNGKVGYNIKKWGAIFPPCPGKVV